MVLEGNDKRKLRSVQKVWISGTTLVVAIPREIREIMSIHKGDYLEVDWGEVIKRDDLNGKDKQVVIKKKKEIKVLDADYLPDM